VPRGTLLGEPEVDRIVQAGIQEVRIRSVLTCEATSGVCAACYGRDLARGTPVNMGESGRRHRGAIDRRAGDAAHHAHVPHRRRGRRFPSSPSSNQLRGHDTGQEPQRRFAIRAATSFA